MAGLLLFLIPEKLRTIKSIFALLISIISTYFTIVIFTGQIEAGTFEDLFKEPGSLTSGINNILNDLFRYSIMISDSLARMIILFIAIISFLIILYSLIYIKKDRVKDYYSYFLITTGCSAGAVFADNLLLFITFWGILGITLYKLIPGRDEESSAAGKKDPDTDRRF